MVTYWVEAEHDGNDRPTIDNGIGDDDMNTYVPQRYAIWLSANSVNKL